MSPRTPHPTTPWNRSKKVCFATRKAQWKACEAALHLGERVSILNSNTPRDISRIADCIDTQLQEEGDALERSSWQRCPSRERHASPA